MNEALSYIFVIMFIGLSVIPFLARKIRVPVIVLELIFGIIIGISGLNLVPDSSIIEFFSSFGIIYLMFLAGLEINYQKFKKYATKSVLISLFSVGVPFVVGVLIARFTGVHPLLLGSILSTSSLGIILPLSKELKYDKNFIQILLGSVVLVDIISLFLFVFSITIIQGSLGASFVYSFLAIMVLFVVPLALSRFKSSKRLVAWMSKISHFETEVRFSFALIFILGAVSGKLGFHSIMGAFIAGLIMSELNSKSLLLSKKLESFGYGFFIPLFFIIMGTRVNVPSLFLSASNVVTFLLIISFGLLSKIVGVSAISKFKGFSFRESLSYGFFHASKLSLVIAAADIGSRLGLVNESVFSSVVLLAIVSALLCPLVGKLLLSRDPNSYRNLGLVRQEDRKVL